MDWELWSEAREQAMQAVLGPMDDNVIHAVIPFQMGYEAGGRADVVSFSQHLDGIVYATTELIGWDGQVPNELGNYELMICLRHPDDWAPELLGRLAYYTGDALVNPRHTMELGSFIPDGSILAGLLFFDYARFRVRDRNAGLLLCLGITQAEVDACRADGTDRVIDGLKKTGVHPFTDFNRLSVV